MITINRAVFFIRNLVPWSRFGRVDVLRTSTLTPFTGCQHVDLWRNREIRLGALLGAGGVLTLLLTAAMGYWLGSSQRSPTLLDLKRVSTAASGQNMAVATGAVSDEAEGVSFSTT